MRKVLLSTVLIGSLVAAEPAIIPLPKTIEEGEGAFSFTNDFDVRYDPALEGVAKLFASDLGARTGSEVGIKHEALKTGFGVEIVLDLDESLPLKPGGYRLKVTPDRIRIRGKDVAGAWHANASSEGFGCLEKGFRCRASRRSDPRRTPLSLARDAP